MTEFVPWPKIPRLSRARLAILEKIDGTNAAVHVAGPQSEETFESYVVGTQSRKRLINSANDNMGFAQWVDSQKKLAEVLGPGVHFGEWAGPGIQKNPLGLNEKYFFLFGWFKWPPDRLAAARELVPNLRVVPLLFEGEYEPGVIQEIFGHLACAGSHVVEHPASAEGIVIHLAGQMFKQTFDDNHKGPAL